MLCMAAAARWGADWQELDARAGFVWRGNDRIPFAELAETALTYTPPEPVALREMSTIGSRPAAAAARRARQG